MREGARQSKDDAKQPGHFFSCVRSSFAVYKNSIETNPLRNKVPCNEHKSRQLKTEERTELQTGCTTATSNEKNEKKNEIGNKHRKIKKMLSRAKDIFFSILDFQCTGIRYIYTHTHKRKWKKLIQANETKTSKQTQFAVIFPINSERKAFFSVSSSDAIGVVVLVVVVTVVVIRSVFSQYPCMRGIGLFRFQFSLFIFFSSI